MKAASGRSWVPWTTLGLFSFGYLLSAFDRMILVLMIGPIQRDLHISDMEFGVLVGPAFSVCHLAAGLPIGWLVDRASRPKIAAVGIALWSTATAMSGIAGSFGQLLAARICVGVGEAAINPAGQSLLSDLFARERLARAMAVFQSGGTIGAGLAFVLGGGLITMFASLPPFEVPFVGTLRSWQLAFFIAGIPGLILACAILAIRDPRNTSSAAPPPQSRSLLPLATFLRQRFALIAAMIGCVACIAIVNYAFMSWAPALMMRSRGLSAMQVGLMMGLAVGGCGVLGYVCGGALGDRWLRQGRKDAYMRVGIVAMCLALPLGLGFIFIQQGFAPSLILACLFLTALSLPVPVMMAGLQLITPAPLKGQIAAIYIVTANLVGMGLGPVLVPAIDALFPGTKGDLSMPIAVILTTFSFVVLAICLSARRALADALTHDDAGMVFAPPSSGPQRVAMSG